ncbi:MAG: DUF4293 domain-containing protein [Bacteroidetes bacterium]|nr:DUF4293 domain-containing protein [Bacteroidota bacterium]
MIQRIQTIYLSLAIIALGILFFFPLASFLSDLSYLKFYITGVKNMAPGGDVPLSMMYVLPLVLLVIAVLFISVMSLLQYKNRPRQIKFTSIAVMLNILAILAILFVYVPIIERKTGVKPDYGYLGIYLPVISLLFLVLANMAIKRDEKLVRSSDRLR